MTDSNRLNRRRVLASLTTMGSLTLAGCSDDSGNGATGNGGGTAGTDGAASGSTQNLGEYGLPHCDTGNYVFQIMEIESENSVQYANFAAKNLTTDGVTIVAVHADDSRHAVDVYFQPQETKTVAIKDGHFGPDSDFRLEIRGADDGFSGQKCSTGSPSREHRRNAEASNQPQEQEGPSQEEVREDAANDAEAESRVQDSETATEQPRVWREDAMLRDFKVFFAARTTEKMEPDDPPRPFDVEFATTFEGDATIDVTARLIGSRSGDTYEGTTTESLDGETTFEWAGRTVKFPYEEPRSGHYFNTHIADHELQDGTIELDLDGEQIWTATCSDPRLITPDQYGYKCRWFVNDDGRTGNY